jgi:asparagine synthase (glutamine-hydrolysing)
MFAFAFLDADRRRLWLGRDPFGIKPLFLTSSNGRIAFASEMRPLVDLGFAPRVVQPLALFHYLRHAITDHGDLTPIEGIRHVPPAHTVEIDIDTAMMGAARRYWTPAIARPAVAANEAAEQLRTLFEQSVRLHLRADVPVAATLSGGIDSSAIIGMMRTVHPSGPAGLFSYIADDPAINEERYVDAAAAGVGVAVEKVRINAEQLAEDLDQLIVGQEQPFTTTSIWAQHRVFRRVHEHRFKVVLDGQGADELLAGYPVFRAARLESLFRSGRWASAFRMMRSMPQPVAGPVMQAVGGILPAGVAAVARRVVRRPDVPGWLNASWFSRHAALKRPFTRASGTGDLRGQLWEATTATSLPMLLRYADRNAMRVSLENRVPFLTVPLAEFALSLPDELLIGPDGTTKRLLRAAMRGVVPDAVLDRRDKIGFVTPEAQWFRQSAPLRAQFARALERPLPACFDPSLAARLKAIAEGRLQYTAEAWRCWNAIRWAQLLRLDFPA